jgi:flavodoxin I
MKIALVYSKHSEHTAAVAALIQEQLTIKATEVNVEDAPFDALLNFDLLILGASTWFDGELPNYWDEYLPGLEDKDFSGKKIALFGLGNQTGYPENYQDAIGILADFFESRGAEIIGHTNTDGYQFESSASIRNGKFCGLAIDSSFTENQIKSLVSDWLSIIIL